MSPQGCSLSTRLQPGTVGLTPLFTTGYSNFKNSGSFYFCNQRTVGVCAQSYACLTAVENICLERTRWSTADIWLLHNKGWGWTPNKQHTHTHYPTHTQQGGSQMAMQEKNKTRQQRFQGHTQTSYLKHRIIAENPGKFK